MPSTIIYPVHNLEVVIITILISFNGSVLRMASTVLCPLQRGMFKSRIIRSGRLTAELEEDDRTGIYHQKNK
jgi:hypothetical protein